MQSILFICTMAVVSELLYFHHCHLHIATVSNKMFGRMLAILFAFSVSGVMNELVMRHLYSSGIILCNIVSAVYYELAVIFMFSIYDYACASAKAIKCMTSKFSIIIGMIFMLFVLIFTNYNPSALYIFVFAIMMCICCFAVLYKHAYNVPILTLRCFYLWLALWLISEAIYHFYYINFATFISAISLLRLFYVSENPYRKIDSLSGFFMSNFITEYILSKHDDNMIFGMIYVHDHGIDAQFIKSLADYENGTYFSDGKHTCYIIGTDVNKISQLLQQYGAHYSSILMIAEHVSADNISNIITYCKRQYDILSESVIHEIDMSAVDETVDNDKMRLEIVNALAENRILTYVQPIYDIHSGLFISGECLCRLQKRNGDILSPYSFIGVAEKTSLISDIETCMFRNMCKCLSDPRIVNSNIKYLEANLSIKKGEQKNLFAEYTTITREYGVTSDKVNLEITETDSMDQKTLILNNMQTMCELGFRFSLDDFGTGESNLGYIIDMPVSIIKFDREITQKSMVDEKAHTVVANVISMAHDLGISVVVEGIETQADFEMSKELGADFVQGYYFSKPMPMEEFIKLVSKTT